MRAVRKHILVTTSLALAATVLTSCADRWCEQDDTDRRVDDSYCERGTSGYEWEPDGDDTKIKVKPKKPKKRR